MKMLLGVLLASASVTAVGQEIDCENANSTVEMKFCSAKRYEAADQRLNALYQEVVKIVKEMDAQTEDYGMGLPKHYAKLVASEKAWIKLRDNNCELEMSFWWGGTGAGLVYTECLTQQTEQRIDYLKTLKENYIDR